ncbi:MAG: Beta-lactamase class C-like and penicillin binding proteins (PBPs) superfamily / DUF3471 domain [uncultured Thermomicrobiales bacterium]|uniref:Beta-lactamase class C-like and penicillin binding proteins (PBPs) superfamily / DUF3471 domain n=1 Tax=uncultured Thermomicrobiales bacterium TaxID=1645740 RepID=A0A6J4VK04_9BACT|nr:MAG: Beta-lactamase class C-like and penicillin binding proteins (PBPs) superfamily / DUF3471 domain [uncultured Thermomicrobiales bacterium]
MAAPEIDRVALLAGFDEVVAGVMRDWRVPGLAVAVVHGDDVLLEREFGFRDAERRLPVTPDTLFSIGSCTKAFTTASLGLLADDGLLDWDEPVRRYLPWFALRDPFASERITPRDLVTHRSGLPRHDLAWYGSPAPRRELVERLRFLEPNKDIRTVWQYQNLMYLAAGYLAGHVAGTEWEELVQRRIFDSLGMASSTFSVDSAQERSDIALPYQERDDEVRRLPFRNIDAVGPAGSIVASLADMTRWLRVQANDGASGGRRLLSEGQLAQMHAPQMVMPSSGRYPEVTNPSYGLGWAIESYRGHTVVQHGGNIDGFSALVALVPRERLGAVVLANLDGVPVPDVVAYGAFDRLLGLDIVPWNERFLGLKSEEKAGAKAGKERVAAAIVPHASPSHPLEAFVGEFANGGYGTLSVERGEEGLRLRLNGFAGPLVHQHYDVFEFEFAPSEERARFVFATDQHGEIASVAAPLEPTVGDIVFVRRPPVSMEEPAFLARFVGVYDLLGAPVTVAFKGSRALQLSAPGMPGYALAPWRGTTFRFAGLADFSVEFVEGEAGTIEAAILTQPNGTFRAPRRS